MKNDDEYTFDKFMDRILLDEAIAKEKLDEECEENPRKKLVERYTERPNNRIRYVKNNKSD